MLFPLCRDFIYSQRTGTKFQKELSVKVINGLVFDEENNSYPLIEQQNDIEGLATKFKASLNENNEVIFSITEITIQGQAFGVNISVNLKQYKNKEIENKSQAILYKSIKKKIIKLRTVIEKSGQKVQLKNCKEEKKEIETQSLTTPQIISQNEISYINRLDKLCNSISRKYVLEYFKKKKINNERFINILFPALQVKKELLEFE